MSEFYAPRFGDLSLPQHTPPSITLKLRSDPRIATERYLLEKNVNNIFLLMQFDVIIFTRTLW